MKKILSLILLFPCLLTAQIQELNYSQTNDVEYVRNIKNNTTVNTYITKDKLKISVGDTLVIGKANVDRKKYILGDVFETIVIGNIKGSMQDFRYLPHDYSGEKVVVQSMFVMHEKYTGYNPLAKRKELPLYVNIYVKSPKIDNVSFSNISSMLSHSRKTIINIEEAFALAEVVNPSFIMSREEAIKKLKEAKDLMELDLLDKNEYEKLRKKLTPIIMKE
tara:strand:- start:247 stop:906 length:660 start_codon:yes stop_codon:yes gene_type:complete